MSNAMNIQKMYEYTQEMYAGIGVDTDKAIAEIDSIPISVQCWQGDDVGGFESSGESLSGGIQATGNYPGKPGNIDEFRSDVERAFSHIPGAKKFNLHAMYLDSPRPVQRNGIEPEHFRTWIQWAEQQGVGLDFNPTCFADPHFLDGMTLSHPDPAIRNFWIQHVQQSRKINARFGQELGKTAILNLWIPDGMKDTPIDRGGPRERLQESLDCCFEEKFKPEEHVDCVEGKLFGIGSESYVVGSHEFYLGYAMRNNIALCIDTGHFHPTEYVSDKLSAVLLFLDQVLLHVSRPVRWDSDHVVTLDNELVALAWEVLNRKKRIHVGLDFFDASINRVAAWVIGARNMRKALLIAALMPTAELIHAEQSFDFTKRLAYQETLKTYPWATVWNYYCHTRGYAYGMDCFADIQDYERNIQLKRQDK